MSDDDLSARLLAEAENYDPAAHARNLLARHRPALLLARARFMSYEQISAMLAKHGIDISPTAIGVFCRRTFTKAEIERVRREQERRAGAPSPHTLPGFNLPPTPSLGAAETTTSSSLHPATPEPGRRGPRIARDDL